MALLYPRRQLSNVTNLFYYFVDLLNGSRMMSEIDVRGLVGSSLGLVLTIGITIISALSRSSLISTPLIISYTGALFLV